MARYDKLRKLERDIQLVRYANKHPDDSLAEIGKAFGISRGRVHQILHPKRKEEKDVLQEKHASQDATKNP